MKLIETTFDNFRCFKRYKINYGTETTVFIGKNGSGKSSVLSGIRRGLSFMFAKPKTYSKNLAISNNAKVKSFNELEANFDPISRSYNYPIKNDFKAVFNNQVLSWSLVKNHMRGGLLTTQYADALNKVLNSYNEQDTSTLPVLAVFSDSFPHQTINSGAKFKKNISQEILPRDLGYYGWDERTNCVDLWLDRFYKVANYENDLENDIDGLKNQILLYEKLIKENRKQEKNKTLEWENTINDLRKNLSKLYNDNRWVKFSNEREFIQHKLMEFTKPLADGYEFINSEFELYRISVNRPNKKAYTMEFSFNDGRVITYDTLPMGYKRMFSIVIDIAYRSYILNEDIESEGIVLIDEIELHLHPTLQQEILQRLRRVFPKIQFIITTHSPLIITNFISNNSNKIIRLEQTENEYKNKNIENIYGIDYNTGLTEIMGANYRKSEIDQLIDSIIILKKFGNTEQSNRIKDELLSLVGKDNKYIQDEIDKRSTQNNIK